MLIDNALHDHSANIARKILNRGLNNLDQLFTKLFNSSQFVYIACPDLSITLRKDRIRMGFPIGGYISWEYDFIPLELVLNSCGIHVVKIDSEFNLEDFRQNLFILKNNISDEKIKVGDTKISWNFAKRNHFINVFKDDLGAHYIVFHAASESNLFNLKFINENFDTKHISINNRSIPFLINNDASKYWEIAKLENSLFYDRHDVIFNILFNNNYEVIYKDLHFGMIDKYEFLMGCSKINVNSIFTLLTRPFNSVFLAKADSPNKETAPFMNNNKTLVPHGLGMAINDLVTDIVPDHLDEENVIVSSKNGCNMVTNLIEHIGIDYRELDVISDMEKYGNFTVLTELYPVSNIKI